MKIRILALLLLSISAFTSHGQSISAKIKAEKIVNASLKAMGDAWQSVNSLNLQGYGYANVIDQSERPEGPYIPSGFSRTIIKDISNNRFSLDEKGESGPFSIEEGYLFDEGAEALKAGGKLLPTVQGQQYYDELNLSPELVLLKALAAPDLAFLKDTIYQKAKHWTLGFRFENHPVRVFLNQETNLITAVEITKPYQNGFFSVWGDSKKTDIYSFWMLLGKGLRYPIQQDSYINGYYSGSFVVNKWNVNPEINTDSLRIPDEVKAQGKIMFENGASALRKQVEQGGTEIKPGVWLVRGPCNSTIISQPDGIVVIEGPYSSDYGGAIIKKANALFPNKKIKALITTSDAWLHIGGVRAFAAIPGIHIYHPVRNKFILEKLLKAHYRTEPDRFAKVTRPSYTLTGIADTMNVGTGNNRLILYAYRTETGDRQMMVYFPAYKLLYASDHYQPKGRDGKYWNTEIVSEVYHSIRDRKLDVKDFYAMHSKGLIPFEEMANDVNTDME